MMYEAGFGLGMWMLLKWLVMAVVMVFALYGLIILLGKSDPGFDHGSASQGPLNILQERLARGEITTEQYREIKQEINNQ